MFNVNSYSSGMMHSLPTGAIMMRSYCTTIIPPANWALLMISWKVHPGKYYPALDQAFQAAKLAMTKEDMIGRGIQYAKEQFPGKRSGSQNGIPNHQIN